MNSNCSKCGDGMPQYKPANGWIGAIQFVTVSYRCLGCGHWNNLKRRNGYAEWAKSESEKKG